MADDEPFDLYSDDAFGGGTVCIFSLPVLFFWQSHLMNCHLKSDLLYDDLLATNETGEVQLISYVEDDALSFGMNGNGNRLQRSCCTGLIALHLQNMMKHPAKWESSPRML